jgi:hypothetical protein
MGQGTETLERNRDRKSRGEHFDNVTDEIKTRSAKRDERRQDRRQARRVKAAANREAAAWEVDV